MTSSSAFKARMGWLLGAGLVLAGFLLLLCFVALALRQLGALQTEALVAALSFGDSLLQPLQLPQAWLTDLRIGLALAMLGVAVAALGVLITRWQSRVIEVERERREDRLRRVQLYRESARREPYIGSGTEAGRDERQRRRVA